MDYGEELWKDRWDPNAETKTYTDFDEYGKHSFLQCIVICKFAFLEMNLLGEFLDGFEVSNDGPEGEEFGYDYLNLLVCGFNCFAIVVVKCSLLLIARP